MLGLLFYCRVLEKGKIPGEYEDRVDTSCDTCLLGTAQRELDGRAELLKGVINWTK